MNQVVRVLMFAAGLTLLALAVWAAWIFFRFNAGLGAFETVRDYIGNQTGLSQPVATVIGVTAGLALSILIVVFIIKTRFLMAALIAVPVIGIPSALWLESLSAGHCFNRQTQEALCGLWESPSGEYQVFRNDGPAPKGGWGFVRNATAEDVAVYSGDPKERQSVQPHPVVVDTCDAIPQFFDRAGRPRVYWSRYRNKLELWDKGGHHPTAGIPLQPMSQSVADELCAYLAAEQQRRLEQLAKESQASQTSQIRDGGPKDEQEVAQEVALQRPLGVNSDGRETMAIEGIRSQARMNEPPLVPRAAIPPPTPGPEGRTGASHPPDPYSGIRIR